MTNYILVGGAALDERLQLVHVRHVGPEGGESRRDLELTECLCPDTDVLQSGHQLAVEAGHGVSGQEASAPLGQEIVDPFEVGEEGLPAFSCIGGLELSYIHLEFGVKIFNESCHFFVLKYIKKLIRLISGYH